MAWVGVAGEFASTLRRLDAGQVDDAALRLRDGFLRDDDDVAVFEPAGAVGGGREQGAQVVSCLDLRYPLQREDAELGHRTPVIRRPACAL